VSPYFLWSFLLSPGIRLNLQQLALDIPKLDIFGFREFARTARKAN